MCESLATRDYRRLHSSLQASHTELDVGNIKIQTRSFKIYGIWLQATNQPTKRSNIHTHVHNAVTLVWGSLRLTPIIY